MLRKLALVVAISPVLWAAAAHALGLGDIDVKSRLNQRFSAVIPLTAVSGEEADNLLVRVADNDDFAKAGIDRADYLSSLNFEVKSDGGSPRIVITSKQVARDPFLNFLLDVRSASGRVLREYTVLLDPPSYADAAAPAKSTSDFYQTAEEATKAAPAPAPVEKVAVPQATPTTTAPAAASTTPAAAAPAATAGASTYGPVQPQETFWSIATKLRPSPAVTMDQVMWSIYSRNPGAFEGGRIGGLLKGAVLKVPTAAEMAAVSPAVAKARISQLRGGHAGSRVRKPASPKIEKAQPEIAPEPTVAPPPAPAAAPASQPKPPAKPAVTTPPAPTTPVPAEKKTPENPPAVVAPVAAPKPAATPTPPPAAEPVAPAPAATAPAATEAKPELAPTTPPEAPAASSTPPAVPAPATAETPPPAAAAPVPMPAPAPAESGGLLDDLLLPAGGVVVLGLLALLGFRVMKQRKGKAGAAEKPSNTAGFWNRKIGGAGKTPPAPPAVPPAPPAPRAPTFAVPPPVPAAKAPAADPLARTVLESKDPATLTQTLASTLANTALTETVKQNPSPNETAQLPTFDSTQIFDTPDDKLAESLNTDSVDFDIAGKFEAETLKVDLDANDPLSEADFHLAYGLYDEAALLLESAAEKNPGRTDLRVKLAETYFRATKPHEFEEVAQSLKPQLDAAEWQKIAIMGSQLIPDSPLFQGAAQNAALETPVDLAFDEPETPAAAPAAAPAPEKAKMSSTGAFSASGAYSASSSSVLDFKLEDLEAASSKPAAAPAPEARKPTGNTLEFNLADFDLSKPGATEPPAAKADPGSETLAFDLGDDFKSPLAEKPGITPAEDIKLDDFDLGELPQDSHAISSGDEAGTKLDLARAYVDMGDNEMARSLLNEVLQQGSGDQKKEAQALLQRLA